MVAHALGVPSHAVTVEIRRMGGGFGGKETQGNQFAALAAIAAKKHRPRGQDPARPRRRHDRDRQAARFRRRLRGRLRRRGPHPRRRLSSMRRAAASRPTCPGRSPTARCSTATTPISGRRCMRSRRRSTPTRCPTRPFAASAGRRAWSAPSASSTRWPSRSARTRSRSASSISTAPTRPQRHALSPDGRGQHHPAHRRGAGGERGLCAAAARDRRLQRQQPHRQARARADAGEVRHLLHRHAVQPGRRAGACLYRRLGASEPRRHRDGAGALRQGRAGGGRGVPDRPRPGEDHRDDDRPRCRTPRRPPPRPAPTSTAWRRRTRRGRSRTG